MGEFMNNYEEIQKNTLAEYMSLFKRPTIINLSNDSGIQKTRLFRLINGMDMRLSEYLILKERITSLSNSEGSLERLSRECENNLSALEVSKLSKILARKLRESNLLKIKENNRKAA